MPIKNTIVVIDAGGRGAVLAKAYAKNPQVKKIIAIPGNDLMKIDSPIEVETHTDLKTTSIEEIIAICKTEKVDLVDVAQDNAVAVGLVDRLNKENITAYGPTQKAGELEWNKAFAREFMAKYDIPQPEFVIFTSENAGVEYLKNQPDSAWFVKASGLAEGKGALPAKNNLEAIERISDLKKLGEAGKTYLLEKWLKAEGGLTNKNNLAEEFSSFAISDGKTWQLIGNAQDHKRALDNDEGENTGGMGAYSHPKVITNEIEQQIYDIFDKTFTGLIKEKRQYKGILYLSGIIVNNKVYVIEYNCRWGDPEAEVIVPSIKNDFFDLSMSVLNQTLDKIKVKTDNKVRVVVAGCSKGYPIDYSAIKGKEILGLDKVLKSKDLMVLGAGIKIKDNKFYASGGRLFYIIGEGKNILQARDKAYSAIKSISIEGNNLHYRTDIGWRDVKRMQ